MNERIKELALKAYNDAGQGTPEELSLFMEVYSEKFAEVIVRECADFLCKNSGYDDCDNAWFPEPEDLLQHFGVEE